MSYKKNSIISSRKDDRLSDDDWALKFERALEKNAVQPVSNDRSVYDQINSIMNGKSKYSSVQAAVDDMKKRSGLTDYLNKITVSKTQETNKIATQQDKQPNKQPELFVKYPEVKQTFQNYVTSTRGNLPIPAIVDKVRSIHRNDVLDQGLWEEEDLLKAIHRMNLVEEIKYTHQDKDLNLGKGDMSDSDFDQSNSDAFLSLTPVKM